MRLTGGVLTEVLSPQIPSPSTGEGGVGVKGKDVKDSELPLQHERGGLGREEESSPS
jgi:hypothetical protein